jgi:anti-repressor protein
MYYQPRPCRTPRQGTHKEPNNRSDGKRETKVMNIIVTPQTINETEVNSVNARELWEKLGVKTPFSMWIKRRVEESMFDEGTDYLVHKNVNPENTGVSKVSIEYIITLDMAKHIAMMEKTNKAKEVRDYFIEVEKKYQATKSESVHLPTTYLEALEALVEKEKALLVYKPKAETYDELMSKDNLMYPTDGCKRLTANPLKLMKILKEQGYIYNNRAGYLRPRPKALELGWFALRDIPHHKDPDKTNQYMFMTLQGVEGIKKIADKAIAEGLIKPVKITKEVA